MCRKMQLLFQRFCPICAFLWLNHFPAQFLWHIQAVECFSEPVQYLESCIWQQLSSLAPAEFPTNHNPISNSTWVTAVQSCWQKWPWLLTWLWKMGLLSPSLSEMTLHFIPSVIWCALSSRAESWYKNKS